MKEANVTKGMVTQGDPVNGLSLIPNAPTTRSWIKMGCIK
jgi:hypothetical protein